MKLKYFLNGTWMTRNLDFQIEQFFKAKAMKMNQGNLVEKKMSCGDGVQ